MSVAAIKVAAAVILNTRNECLLSLRALHKHQGGKWEFPGGKLEAGETPLQALCREVLEELDLHITQARPLLITTHAYADKQVTLDVWLVSGFSGQPKGMEGQELGWFSFAALQKLDFPTANYPIIQALDAFLHPAD